MQSLFSNYQFDNKPPEILEFLLPAWNLQMQSLEFSLLINTFLSQRNILFFTLQLRSV